MNEQNRTTCPVHKEEMVESLTKYGPRYDCEVQGCDWMCWSGSTSTPSNQLIRRGRNKAHIAFDKLWEDGKWKRHHAYNWLSQKMGMNKKDCHIGMFDVEQCEKVVTLVSKKLNGITKQQETQQ